MSVLAVRKNYFKNLKDSGVKPQIIIKKTADNKTFYNIVSENADTNKTYPFKMLLPPHVIVSKHTSREGNLGTIEGFGEKSIDPETKKMIVTRVSVEKRTDAVFKYDAVMGGTGENFAFSSDDLKYFPTIQEDQVECALYVTQLVMDVLTSLYETKPPGLSFAFDKCKEVARIARVEYHLARLEKGESDLKIYSAAHLETYMASNPEEQEVVKAMEFEAFVRNARKPNIWFKRNAEGKVVPTLNKNNQLVQENDEVENKYYLASSVYMYKKDKGKNDAASLPTYSKWPTNPATYIDLRRQLEPVLTYSPLRLGLPDGTYQIRPMLKCDPPIVLTDKVLHEVEDPMFDPLAGKYTFAAPVVELTLTISPNHNTYRVGVAGTGELFVFYNVPAPERTSGIVIADMPMPAGFGSLTPVAPSAAPPVAPPVSQPVPEVGQKRKPEEADVDEDEEELANEQMRNVDDQ